MEATDLCTLDQVKDYMGMTGSNATIDNLLETLITSMTDFFHSLCGVNQFKSKSYTEYYSGNKRRTMFLDQKPVISIESVAIDNDWVWASDSTISSDEYMLVDNELILKSDYFISGDANVKIIYTAGYSTIPNDLSLACVMETVRIFKRRESIDIISKSYDGGGSVTRYMEGMLPEVRMILKKYRNVGVM
jgi:hypothetical protein